MEPSYKFKARTGVIHSVIKGLEIASVFMFMWLIIAYESSLWSQQHLGILIPIPNIIFSLIIILIFIFSIIPSILGYIIGAYGGYTGVLIFLLILLVSILGFSLMPAPSLNYSSLVSSLPSFNLNKFIVSPSYLTSYLESVLNKTVTFSNLLHFILSNWYTLIYILSKIYLIQIAIVYFIFFFLFAGVSVYRNQRRQLKPKVKNFNRRKFRTEFYLYQEVNRKPIVTTSQSNEIYILTAFLGLGALLGFVLFPYSGHTQIVYGNVSKLATSAQIDEFSMLLALMLLFIYRTIINNRHSYSSLFSSIGSLSVFGSFVLTYEILSKLVTVNGISALNSPLFLGQSVMYWLGSTVSIFVILSVFIANIYISLDAKKNLHFQPSTNKGTLKERAKELKERGKAIEQSYRSVSPKLLKKFMFLKLFIVTIINIVLPILVVDVIYVYFL